MKFKSFARFLPGSAPSHSEATPPGSVAVLSMEDLQALIEERCKAVMRQETKQFQVDAVNVRVTIYESQVMSCGNE